MIDNKRVLALIPARGGSKGIKDKNIVEVMGRPLINYTIEAAKGSKYIDRIVVSTDSIIIKNISEESGADVPFLRPEYLASDTATTLEAVLHAIYILEEMGDSYDILVLLQTTSPLRTTKDIDGAIETFIENECNSVVAVSPVNDSPILIRTIDQNGKLKKLLKCGSTIRRQDMPTYYRVNGSIYVNLVQNINKYTSFNDNGVPYFMDKERSLDIDEPIDLELFKYYLNNE